MSKKKKYKANQDWLFPLKDGQSLSQLNAITFEIPDSLDRNDSIDVFNFPLRTTNALKNWGLETVGNFLDYPDDNFFEIKHIGVKACHVFFEIKRKIREEYNVSNIIRPDNSDKTPRPWENIPIEELWLPTRIENVLIKSGINTFGQLYDFPENKLLKIQNIGYGTVRLLAKVKNKIINQKRYVLLEVTSDDTSTEMINKSAEDKHLPLDKLIDSLLERCGDERSREIIVRRYGLITGERQTLEEISEDYNVTRERIRQIQVKTLKKLRHPSYKRPIIKIFEELLYKNGGIVSDERADKIIPEIFENKTSYSGGHLLDLLCGLGWIQDYHIGDLALYSPLFNGISLEKISDTIFSTIGTDEFGVEFNEMVPKIKILNEITDSRMNKEELILSYCLLDPRIEEYDNFQIHTSDDEISSKKLIFRNYSPLTKKWVNLIKSLLIEEQAPLHFTEITDRVNDRLFNTDKKLNVRRTHGVLIGNPEFAHSGIRGTWGLTEWGIRKESTPELVNECLKKAGFPLHWKQIYNYVTKYKDTKPINIIAILESKQEFEKKSKGVYGFR